ncbi:hypothetical protein PR202_ga29409 [Eleusine coracana subsp. coracana]|uniref:Uncharacterized protein n=1 Tax=Eleusine coracana subsp. coracana TaxID=191504 RepID=A0AAV5DM26_ELECO|nr:hypothetical protein PR202_ga29409 [Eleusine coracana subsp. coracana]
MRPNRPNRVRDADDVISLPWGSPSPCCVPVPVVADFSSRGPHPVVPELLKADIVAPGVNILAAWSGDVPLTGEPEFDDGKRAPYKSISK